MTVLVTMDVPFNREFIEQISAELGAQENPPDGLYVHVITETPEGTHVVDIWESAEKFKAFEESRLMPAVAKAMADSGMQMPENGPAPTITDAFDLVVGQSA
jgi:heme-degrading monooxygenase HmoA